MAARDVVAIGVIIFIFGIGFLIIHYVMGVTVDKMISIPQINESAGAVTSLRGITTLTNKFDYMIFSLFIALILSLIITGWFIGGNPIFMFIYFIVIIIAVILGGIFANIWEDVSQTTIFSTTLLSFPITNHILLNLPLYLAVIGFIGVVVMFAKPYFQEQ